MRVRRSFSIGLLMLGWNAQAEEPSPTHLYPAVPAEIFLAPGRSTTLLLRTAAKVSAISVASPIISYKYDRALNQIEITPTVRTAGVETNLNLRIGPDVYVLVAKVVTDVRAQFVRTFVPKTDANLNDESALTQVPPLKPSEIGLVEAAQTIERALVDAVFRAANPNLKIEPLGHIYGWNDCLVSLVDATQFTDRDLIVFRVQWLNRTNDALHLDVGQYALFVHDRKIPIIARYKPSGAGSLVYPGQLESVYLAVQGHRLSRHNAWQLKLPLDAAELGRRLSR